MKTINTSEELPEYFYIFLSFANNVVGQANMHNFNHTKRIHSSGMMNCIDQKAQDYIEGNIDYLPFAVTRTTSNTPSTFMMNVINEYNIEHNLEVYRRTYYKVFPSRFSGLFAFGSIEDCKKASVKHGWNMNEVKRFRLVTNYFEPFYKVAKLNMEIISLMRGITLPIFSVQEQDKLYAHYWLGRGDIAVQIPQITSGEPIIQNSGEIYEYLIEGFLEEA